MKYIVGSESLTSWLVFVAHRGSYPDHEEHQMEEAAGGAPAEGEEEEEEEVLPELLEEENYQLVLPSGIRIVHVT